MNRKYNYVSISDDTNKMGPRVLTQYIDGVPIEFPKEFLDLYKPMLMGAYKYNPNDWLEYNPKTFNHKSNHDSMFHHLCDSRQGIKEDHESGLHPLLHLALRALMQYTKENRGVMPNE